MTSTAVPPIHLRPKGGRETGKECTWRLKDVKIGARDTYG